MSDPFPLGSDTATDTSRTAEPAGQAAEQRRILELELIKIRREASAARLEARAAEIEIMLHELDRAGGASAAEVIVPPDRAAAALPCSSLPLVESWDQLRELVQTTSSNPQSPQSLASPLTDAGQGADAPPEGLREATSRHVGPLSAHEHDPSTETTLAGDEVAGFSGWGDHPMSVDPAAPAEPATKPRARPAAWLLSALFHGVILVVLAAIGLQTRPPRDQVAIQGSAAEASEVSMESFELETAEPAAAPQESAPREMDEELSPTGEIAAASLAPEAAAVPAPPTAAPLTRQLNAAAATALRSDSDAKVQFCGVEGGGNHFVYLVDSSRSMGAAFPSARQQLLASVEALKPNQRFYVIFFDRQPDYMRLNDPGRDEPRSVYATPEHKLALQRWAMEIEMNPGWAPYEPIEFVLKKLKPDALFLLSDGDFPQTFEDLVSEANRRDNLFGDAGPISIIHTISYHSDEGAQRMRRIAAANGGQYRHVPP